MSTTRLKAPSRGAPNDAKAAAPKDLKAAPPRRTQQKDAKAASASRSQRIPSVRAKAPRAKRPSPLAPRKSPRQDRSAHTVAILVEAAAQVLEADGLEGFNTNAIARRAGVSVGSIYQYFPGKDALIIALMLREDARFHDEGAAALKRTDGREAMALYIEAAVRQQLARPRLARLLDVEESRPDIQRAMEGTKTFRALLVDVIASDTMPRQERPQVAAMDVSAIIRGLTDGAGERGESDFSDLRRRITAAVFGYLDGMRADDGIANASSKRRARQAA